jgi:hypothetical protein
MRSAVATNRQKSKNPHYKPVSRGFVPFEQCDQTPHKTYGKWQLNNKNTKHNQSFISIFLQK